MQTTVSGTCHIFHHSNFRYILIHAQKIQRRVCPAAFSIEFKVTPERARARTGNQPKQPAASANQCCLPRGAEEKEEEEEATEQKGASKTSAVFEPLDNPQKPVHIETDE
jgi:hypothetical protein